MKTLKCIITFLFMTIVFLNNSRAQSNSLTIDPDKMMVRIAELEIKAEHIDEYISILKEEAEASIRLEPGVVCIFPIYEKERPTEIRILEIYATKEAYESHLQTPHFKHYKSATFDMVKSLKLVDMSELDFDTMKDIFKKVVE